MLPKAAFPEQSTLGLQIGSRGGKNFHEISRQPPKLSRIFRSKQNKPATLCAVQFSLEVEGGSGFCTCIAALKMTASSLLRIGLGFPIQLEPASSSAQSLEVIVFDLTLLLKAIVNETVNQYEHILAA